MDKTIYELCCDAVCAGVPVVINLQEQSLMIGNRLAVSGGVVTEEFKKHRFGSECFEVKDVNSLQSVLDRADELYQMYKHSVPSKKEPRNPYFKALKYDDLSEQDKLVGYPRALARVRLELFLLAFIILKGLVWNEEVMGKWYYQSKKDKDFIILRQWVNKE